MKLEFFLDSFSKSPQVSNFMKILPVGVELLHAHRHDGANIHISQFYLRARKQVSNYW